MTTEPTEPTGPIVEEPIVVPDPDPDPVPAPVEPEVVHPDYDPAPPMVNLDPEITSVFMKVSRAVDGDDHFKQRVEMALEIMGSPTTRANLIYIARSVADSIFCTVSGHIDTSAVTDEQIMSAMESLPDTN